MEKQLRKLQKEHSQELNRLQAEMLELAKVPSSSSSTSKSQKNSADAVENNQDSAATEDHQSQKKQQQQQQQQNYYSSLLMMDSSSNNTNQQGGTRLEKQVAKLSAELSEERIKNVKLQKEHQHLVHVHDVLLQMHGQLIEQMTEMEEKNATEKQ